MADDTMEISSDHGHNGEEEDIDIDIDLTEGHVDEDYVLEDATSNDQFADGLEPHTFPAVDDDPMMDGDESSYHMEDEELLDVEGEEHIEHEAVTVKTVSADAPQHDLGDNSETAFLQVHSSAVAADATWEELEKNDTERPPSQEHAADTSFIEVRDLQEVTEKNESIAPQAHTNAETNDDSRSPTPRNNSPSLIVQEEHKSPPTSSTEHADPTPHHSPEYELIETQLRESAESGKVDNTTRSPLNESSVLPIQHDVIVLYQSVEYALFSTTESDDPDSFFLADQSLIEESLANLLTGIREVIHEDLSQDEELCIAVEDLGLEFEESTVTTQNIKLSQILSLYEKLLHNEGVEQRPLHIMLSTRQSFAQRLTSLIAGAAEGKGLSELVSWDEQSEGLDNAEEVYEDKQNYTATEENQNPEDFLYAEDILSANVPEQPTDDNSVHPVEGDEQGELSEVISSQVSGNVGGSPSLEQESTRAGDNDLNEPALPKSESTIDGEVDEDGDLIDYSEEEDNAQVEQKRSESKAAMLQNDSHSTSNEYESINDELRRKSLSRAAEAKDLESRTENADDALRGVTNGQPSPENGIVGEKDLESVEDSSLKLHDVNYTSDILDASAESMEHAVPQENDDLEEDEYFKGHELSTDGANDKLAPLELENDAEAQSSVEPRNLNGISSGDVYSLGIGNGHIHSHINDSISDEIQYEEDLDGGVFDEYTKADNLHVANEGAINNVNVEDEDEIDYEDDEEEKEQYSTAVKSSEPVPATNNGIGKRSRADADSDDAGSLGSKEAKRPRS